MTATAKAVVTAVQTAQATVAPTVQVAVTKVAEAQSAWLKLGTADWWVNNLGEIVGAGLGALLAYFFGYILLKMQLDHKELESRKALAKDELDFLETEVVPIMGGIFISFDNVKKGKGYSEYYHNRFEKIRGTIFKRIDSADTANRLQQLDARLQDLSRLGGIANQYAGKNEVIFYGKFHESKQWLDFKNEAMSIEKDYDLAMKAVGACLNSARKLLGIK